MSDLREKIADIILDCRDPKRAYQGADAILAIIAEALKEVLDSVEDA